MKLIHTSKHLLGKRIFLFSCFLALMLAEQFVLPLAAQDTTRLPSPNTPRIGITAGYAMNRHTADFLEFDGLLVPWFDFRNDGGKRPPNFREGVGNGIFAGFSLNLLPNDAISLLLRATFAQHNATLTTQEAAPALVLQDSTVDPNSYFLHNVETGLASVGMEALAKWNVFGTGVNVLFGGRFAYMLPPKYTHKEQFVSPAGGIGGFMLGSQAPRFSAENADIPNTAPLQLHALGGISYEFMLGERLRIAPEVMYAFALTNALQARNNQPSEGNAWSLHQFRGGVNVSLPLPEPPSPVLPPPPDTLRPLPILAVNAVGVQEVSQSTLQPSSAQETESVILRVEQTISRSVFPLLPYVFFDGVGTTTLPERYALLKTEQTSAFRESKLSSAYELVPQEHSYYHVLNIIGERLRKFPKATLSIHGCTDGFTAERDKADVAKSRGRVVMRYLKDVWKIEESRLKLVENTPQPVTPSVPLNDIDKQAENRRVELRSDTPQVLANITLIDTVRRVSPPTVRFRTELVRIDSVRSWRLLVRQKGRIVKEMSGKYAIPPVLDWRVDERELATLHLSADGNAPSTSLEYTLSCIDSNGDEHRSEAKTISLETRTEEKNSARTRTSSFFAGKLVERFNLILFDFAKSTITDAQTPMMNLMKTRITPRSTVRVDGFTDRTGEAEFNRKLSFQRALGVAQALGFTPEQQQSNVMGYGSSLELYNNDLPEGRFYSRTVRVIVETPQSE